MCRFSFKRGVYEESPISVYYKKFTSGINAYVDGDWKLAKSILNECRLIQAIDRPRDARALSPPTLPPIRASLQQDTLMSLTRGLASVTCISSSPSTQKR